MDDPGQIARSWVGADGLNILHDFASKFKFTILVSRSL